MPTRLLLLVIAALLNHACGGGDKHLPSSNPPEYDPKKVYTAPSQLPVQLPIQLQKPIDPEPSPITLPSLEPGPNERGTWHKMPIKPGSLQLFERAKTVCDALSQFGAGPRQRTVLCWF